MENNNALILLGSKIKSLRENMGLTQEELGKKVGYTSRSSINKVENGDVDLPRSKIIAFAHALNTTPAYLMGWDEPPEEPEILEKFPDDIVILARGAKTLTKDQIDLVKNLIDNMNKQNED